MKKIFALLALLGAMSFAITVPAQDKAPAPATAASSTTASSFTFGTKFTWYSAPR